MPTLLYMPWCPIDKEYNAGAVSLVPFRRDRSLEGLNQQENLQIRNALGNCVDPLGEPVGAAALVRFGDRSLFADLSDEEIEAVHDCLSLAAFAGMANRELFRQHGAYCNADCFNLIAQVFGGGGIVTLTARRREGRALDCYLADAIRFSMPLHVRQVRSVLLDQDVLSALCRLREGHPDDQWPRWQNAISCFNWANTDSETASAQMEGVLMSSAFERILDAKPKAKEVAGKFARAIAPSSEILVRNAKRRGNQWEEETSLRYQWIREFYGLRGQYAHGRLMPQRPAVWRPLEHLVLASIAFPLLVKSLLQEKGEYQPTVSDLAQTDSFEALADQHFLSPPDNQAHSEDSVWGRILEERTLSVLSRQMAQDPQWIAFIRGGGQS